MRSKFQQLALALALALAASALCAQMALARKDKENSSSQMPEQKRAIHALNRLTFGPRPGDSNRVMAMGVDQWKDQQLHPDKIDDHALEARLVPLRTLRMDTRDIVENFPPERAIKAVAEGKQSLPSDPSKRADYKAQLELFEEKQERKQGAADPPLAPGKAELADDERARRREERLYADLRWEQILNLPPDQRMREILRMPPEDQRALATSLKGDKRDEFLEGMYPKQRETLMALNNPQQVVLDELVQAKLLRAIYSERQLQEVMADFWFNHFNVFIGKGADRYLLTSYERDVIRPHALGKFEDLLVATAQSPAMLFYLDNWLSVGPNSEVANGIPKHNRRRARYSPLVVKQGKGRRTGLNENYGRELMELHTLGVNGGYTQKDVTEVARCFTGWTIEKPRQYADFKFDDRLHDPDAKYVLGKKIHAGGMKDGEQVIDLLVHHPSTARFISTKLARRFVSDNPPPALVNRMAETFQSSDGDIHAVLKTMIWSPEFWSRESYRAKIKTPFELVVSAVRAMGTDVDTPMPLVQWVARIGEPLYQCQPPTGYSDKADAWVNTGALLNRLNYSLALAGNKMRGARTDVASLLGVDSSADPKAALDRAVQVFLGGQAGPTTVETLEKQLDNPQVLQAKLDDAHKQVDLGVVAGLVLGAPEFQRH